MLAVVQRGVLDKSPWAGLRRRGRFGYSKSITAKLRRLSADIVWHWARVGNEARRVLLFSGFAELDAFYAGPIRDLHLAERFVSYRESFYALDGSEAKLVKPLVILSSPRSGSTLLFELLMQHKTLWSIGDESQQVIDVLPGLHPRHRAFASNRLTAADATTHIRALMPTAFLSGLRDHEGCFFLEHPARPHQVRMVEKTPRNALRIPFLHAVFPDAFFVALVRRPEAAIASIMQAWRARRFRGYTDLPGWKAGECWQDGEWAMLLPPDWQSLNGKPLVEIAAHQWQQANQIMLDDLEKLPPSQWCLVDFDRMVADGEGTIRRLCELAGLPPDERLFTATRGELPLSSTTVSPPDPNKWKKDPAILSVMPRMRDLQDKIQKLVDARALP